MSRGLVLFLEVEPDLEEPDDLVEDLETVVDSDKPIVLWINGCKYTATATAFEAEPWSAKVTSAQVFG